MKGQKDDRWYLKEALERIIGYCQITEGRDAFTVRMEDVQFARDVLSTLNGKRGKVFVLEKLWFDRYGYDGKSHCDAFDSFHAANRAMLDDVTKEYIAHDCQNYDKDGFYTEQARPLESDDSAVLKFRNEERIEWKIHEAKIEGESDEKC